MYVDGLILLGIYSLACAALIMSIYNFFVNKEIEERLNRKPKQRTRNIAPPVVSKRPKGHWD